MVSICSHLTSVVGQLPLVEGKSVFCLPSINLDVKSVMLTLETLDGPQRSPDISDLEDFEVWKIQNDSVNL